MPLWDLTVIYKWVFRCNEQNGVGKQKAQEKAGDRSTAPVYRTRIIAVERLHPHVVADIPRMLPERGQIFRFTEDYKSVIGDAKKLHFFPGNRMIAPTQMETLKDRMFAVHEIFGEPSENAGGGASLSFAEKSWPPIGAAREDDAQGSSGRGILSTTSPWRHPKRKKRYSIWPTTSPSYKEQSFGSKSILRRSDFVTIY